MGRSFGGERLSIDYARLPGSTLEQRRKAIECENILVDILKFDGFFGANFDILKPKWIPTAIVGHFSPILCASHCWIGLTYAFAFAVAEDQGPSHLASAGFCPAARWRSKTLSRVETPRSSAMRQIVFAWNSWIAPSANAISHNISTIFCRPSSSR